MEAYEATCGPHDVEVPQEFIVLILIITLEEFKIC